MEGTVQSRNLFVGQAREQDASKATEVRLHSGSRCPSLVGEANQRGTAVGGVRAAGYQTGRFQRIDQVGYIARRAVQCLAQLSLGHGFLPGQAPENFRTGACQAARNESLVQGSVELRS